MIRGLEQAPAVWNLFWMSVSALDVLPSAGKNWTKLYHPKDGALKAIIRDVTDDEALFRSLTRHPEDFAAWFRRQDPTIFDCFEVFGGMSWVSTVLQRAADAATRIVAEDPLEILDSAMSNLEQDDSAARKLVGKPIVQILDNVLVVDFKKLA